MNSPPSAERPYYVRAIAGLLFGSRPNGFLNSKPSSLPRRSSRRLLRRTPLRRSGPLTMRLWNWSVADWRGLVQRLPHNTATAGLSVTEIEGALFRLEAEGFVLRGRFTPGTEETEWCARRLLARIHSYTLNWLRQEIEPVSSADLMRFLLAWQRIAAEHQVEGPASLAAVIEQLEGFESPAAAWEGELLPSRVADYDPVLARRALPVGQVMWARLDATQIRAREDGASAPVRTTPIALLERKNPATWDPFVVRPDLRTRSRYRRSRNLSTTTSHQARRVVLQ